MADALLLGGQRVVPHALRDGGYEFLHANLAEAVMAVLHSPQK